MLQFVILRWVGPDSAASRASRWKHCHPGVTGQDLPTENFWDFRNIWGAYSLYYHIIYLLQLMYMWPAMLCASHHAAFSGKNLCGWASWPPSWQSRVTGAAIPVNSIKNIMNCINASSIHQAYRLHLMLMITWNSLLVVLLCYSAEFLARAITN